MTSLLIDGSHGDSSVVVRTEHSDSDTLTRFHNLQGDEGLNQQRSLYNSKNYSHLAQNAKLEPQKKLSKCPAEAVIVVPTTRKPTSNCPSLKFSEDSLKPWVGTTLISGGSSTKTVIDKSGSSSVCLPDSNVGSSARVEGSLGLGSFIGGLSTGPHGTENITINYQN